MPQPKRISEYQMYELQFLLNQNNNWIEEQWETMDGEKNYAGMIENMRSSINFKFKANVDKTKYITDDANVPISDVKSKDDKENEISQFGLEKLSIYCAAKQTLAKRPWYRFLLHPIDSYNENKALNNLKNEITSMYGVTDKMLENVVDFSNGKIKNSDSLWFSVETDGTTLANMMDENDVEVNKIKEKYDPTPAKTIETEEKEIVWDDDDEPIKENAPKIDTKKATLDLQSKLAEEQGISNKQQTNPAQTSKKIDPVEHYLKNTDPTKDDF